MMKLTLRAEHILQLAKSPIVICITLLLMYRKQALH